MNDRYDAGYESEGYELVGYDEYGRPMYRQVPVQQTPQQTYDAYGSQGQGQGYGYDPYAADGGRSAAPPAYGGTQDTGAQQPVPAPGDPYQAYHQQPYEPYEPYPQQTGQQQPYDAHRGGGYGSGVPADPYAPYDPSGGGHDPYGRSPAGGQQPRTAAQQPRVPHQAGPPAGGPAQDGPDAVGGAGHTGGPGPTGGPGDDGAPDYRTEQFAFVEEPSDDSEDVIDWLKFTENRTERREEARRRARSRLVALAVVLALVAAGGVGYLWYAGKLPGLSSSGGGTGTSAAAGAQKRDVIVVHLHDTAGGGTSTALLVDNTTTKQGTTVLLPNTLALASDDGSATTLAKSVKDDGSAGTRDQLDTVLGTSIQGTWRLDTPYLQNLVDLVGGIEADIDADVPDRDAKKKGTTLLVHKGTGQTLSGRMAVAYATYLGPGEDQNARLKRFGQVMQGVLRKISSDPQAATVTVQTLAQILDPSLTDQDLGTFLAKLSELAKGGDCRTALLPVQSDGRLTARTSDSVVKDILGGTAKSPGQGSAVRVSVQNASGTGGDTDKARVTLLNGGFTFLDGGTASAARPASEVSYADDAHKDDATEAAKTLGLPASAVKKGPVGTNADVSVVLGQDYKPGSAR
ncbi:LytR C-terminal domain-containing protein [Streptomyces sp. NPDC003703]|uniref:LCP family protein n=1 Tax=Streptomyces sp. NPDC003283 TaxID=3364681 RepID=UPI0036A5FDF4